MDQPLKFEAASVAHGREAVRDSLLLVAVVRQSGGTEHNTRVRNLSMRGMMADCTTAFEPDEPVMITLRGVGDVSGRIAWANGERIGVEFDRDIDPKAARKPVGRGKVQLPHFMKTAKSDRLPLKPR